MCIDERSALAQKIHTGGSGIRLDERSALFQIYTGGSGICLRRTQYSMIGVEISVSAFSMFIGSLPATCGGFMLSGFDFKRQHH